FELQGADDVTLDRLSITGGNYGVRATGDSDRLTVSNSRVFGNADHGVYVDNTGEGAAIVNNTVFSLPGASATNQPYGIDVSGEEASITGNTVYATSGVGIQLQA